MKWIIFRDYTKIKKLNREALGREDPFFFFLVARHFEQKRTLPSVSGFLN